jgi:hypothetical protein
MSLTVSSRSGIRIKVLLAAEMIVGNRHLPMRIRNVSRTGLAGDARRPPQIGSTVTFKRGAAERSGQIVWVDGQRFGVRFTHPLEEDELRLHFPQPERQRTDELTQPLFRWASSQAGGCGRPRHDGEAGLDSVEACMEVISSEGISLGFVDEVEDAGITIIPHGQHRSSKLFLTTRSISSVGSSVRLCLRADELGINYGPPQKP